MKIVLRLALLIFLFTFNGHAQQPEKLTSSEIYESIKKLNFLGSVLYVAAHPDDENTRLISYMSNYQKARTAYLSMTRGDGGQNLVGPEIRELLGVIRTQELLAARRIDGGEQLFTRANDFGYSKHPDETLEIWNKKEVLGDVVLAMRRFKPDVIINRFDHRTAGRTHGHHTSSAMLSMEAFDLAGRPDSYPDQLERTRTWQPKRLFFNTSWWFYGSQENFEKADKSNMLAFDTGVYFSSLGLSNQEIAALSRTNHKSQGFGSTGDRGESIEYIELLKGDLPTDKTNIFDGIDTSWNRVKGGEAIGEILRQVETEFEFKNPAAAIPKLMQAFTLIGQLEDEHWKSIKLNEIREIIAQCAGLYLEAVSTNQQATIGETVQLNIEAINRSPVTMQLLSIAHSGQSNIRINKDLADNQIVEIKDSILISEGAKLTSPYWLLEKGSLGMYKVDNPDLISKPESTRDYSVKFNLEINGLEIDFIRPIVYKANDPVDGEVYRPFEIVPIATSRFLQDVFIFSDDSQKDIQVIVKANKDNLEGYVDLAYPENWNIYPARQKFQIDEKGQEQFLTYTVIPPSGSQEGYVEPKIHIGNQILDKKQVEIDYDHIPYQTILMLSESKLVKIDIARRGDNIAYIEGAGDVVPESLRNIGYNVAILKPEDINAENLQRFDAVVIGIRAYNVLEDIENKQPMLFEYVKNGGNMIVQYNTSRGIKVENLAPYKIELSRDRVTDETSEVRIINPDHEVMNFPNTISPNDFDGWTQERGLYFPGKWSDEFEPILSMNDKDEAPTEGSLLVAKYGKGHYVYTGLSFFREFPAGVPGAFRLFANILSLGRNDLKTDKTLED